MLDDKTYRSNLKRWALFCPKAAAKLSLDEAVNLVEGKSELSTKETMVTDPEPLIFAPEMASLDGRFG